MKIVSFVFILALGTFLFSNDDLKSAKDVDRLLLEIEEEKRQQEAKKAVLSKQQNDEIKFYTSRLTLKESVLDMMENSLLIKASYQEVIQLKQELLNAKGEFYPTLSLSSSITDVNNEEDDGTTKTEEKNNVISLSQNLFAGFSTVGKYNQQKNNYLNKVYKHKGLIEKEIYNAITAYMGVVFAKEAMESNRENVEKLDEILELVQVKYDNGAVTAGDLNVIKAGVSNAKNSLVTADSKYYEALDFYEYTIKRLEQNQKPFQTNISMPIRSLEKTLDRAYEENSLYMAEVVDIRSKKAMLTVANAKRYPSVDFKYTITDLEITGDDPSKSKKTTAMVKVSYDFYLGGKTEQNIVKARSSIEQMEHKLRDKEKKIKWNIRKLHKSITSLSASIANSKIELISNTKVVASYWDEFKLGTKDLQKLLNAQKSLNTARNDFIKYRKSRILDYFKLLEQTGEILDYFQVPYHSQYGMVE
ncbi:MAG: TolC family protein [Campylobacterales bacterium]|nr:TolC family protein [Campylobacterales bacterium]